MSLLNPLIHPIDPLTFNRIVKPKIVVFLGEHTSIYSFPFSLFPFFSSHNAYDGGLKPFTHPFQDENRKKS
jgi:hypothetical protein